MRSFGLIASLFLALVTFAFADLDFQPRRVSFPSKIAVSLRTDVFQQPPQAFFDFPGTQTSRYGTPSVPVTDAGVTTIPEVKAVAGGSDTSTAGRPAAVVAVFVTIAGVLFGLGMGV